MKPTFFKLAAEEIVQEEKKEKKIKKEVVQKLESAFDKAVQEHGEELIRQAQAKGLSRAEAELALKETNRKAKAEVIVGTFELAQELAEKQAIEHKL